MTHFPSALVEVAARKIHYATSKAMAKQGRQPLEEWEDTDPRWRRITRGVAEISLESLLDEHPLEAYGRLLSERFRVQLEDMQLPLERMALLRPLLKEWGYLQ